MAQTLYIHCETWPNNRAQVWRGEEEGLRQGPLNIPEMFMRYTLSRLKLKLSWNTLETPLKYPQNTHKTSWKYYWYYWKYHWINYQTIIESPMKTHEINLHIPLKHPWDTSWNNPPWNNLGTTFKHSWKPRNFIETPLKLPWNTHESPLKHPEDTLETP